MALSAPAGHPGTARPDHGFHVLRVQDVVAETADSSSFVLDVPTELQDRYEYEPGQFLTFRCTVEGVPHLRSYSMSSAPGIDERLTVTVKRVPGGAISNWMLDTLAPGDEVETTGPAGVFGRRAHGGDVLAFAGGSGITPVLSVLKHVLVTTTSRARLFYANREPGSVIFDAELERLAGRHPGRLEVVHHLDSDRGLVSRDEIAAFTGDCAGIDCYLCGPAPFMELVEPVLRHSGAGAESVNIERFTPADGAPVPVAPREDDGGPSHDRARVVIELDGRVEEADYRPGTTILQTARQLGLAPPFSCEAGNCATCMARVVEGAATMHTNNALTEDEVADNWILTCQGTPTTSRLHVVYGWDEA